MDMKDAEKRHKCKKKKNLGNTNLFHWAAGQTGSVLHI